MPLTYFYAELLGILIGAVALSLLINRRMMLQVFSELVEQRVALFVVALVSLLFGSVIVLTHNVWTGSSLDILVTLLGWLLVLRSVLLLFLPHGVIRKIVDWVRIEQTYYLVSVIALIVGGYLIYYGFGL